MLGDFQEALRLMEGTSMTAVEISALRLPELPVLIGALPELDLGQFSYVSVHAPSRFSADEEDGVIALLRQIPVGRPIVVHPDTIHDSGKWAGFGSQLAIENMDRRKSDGRSAGELSRWFERLPDARLCFDLAHAHQCDRTMTEAFRILMKFRDRVCQLHISELDSAGHHFPLSYGSMQAFSEIASLIPPEAPAILESLNPLQGADDDLQKAWIEREMNRASSAIGRGGMLPIAPIVSRQVEIPAAALPA
jgi:rhodanese-related sulfurtransferase